MPRPQNPLFPRRNNLLNRILPVKNDAAAAEAIAAAVRQPGMRYVKPKSMDRQSAAILLETEQNLVKARAACCRNSA